MSIFSSVKGVRAKKNAFNLSHDSMFTTGIGKVIPCCHFYDLIPNSDIKLSVSELARFQALLAPLQHKVDCYIHFWSVPYRLLDDKFTDFISGNMMKNTEEQYDPPYFTYIDLFDFLFGLADFDLTKDFISNLFLSQGSIFDQLGYPQLNIDLSQYNDWESLRAFLDQEIPQLSFTVRPLQSYYWIWLRWYSNSNISSDNFNTLSVLIDEFTDKNTSSSTSNTIANIIYYIYLNFGNLDGLLPHTWSKDYFTSALPFVQVGDPVTLSLQSDAPVTGDLSFNNLNLDNFGFANQDIARSIDYNVVATGNADGSADIGLNDNDASTPLITPVDAFANSGDAEQVTGLSADLSEATAITINELRIANALQSLKESFARFGTRFNEYLKGFFNQNFSDKSLQLPQYLRGGKLPISVSEIEQNAPSTDVDDSPLGTLAGKGIGVSANFTGFKYHVEEPCLILGLLFIKPKAVYANQGVDRHLTKLNDLFDFFNPKTEHLGEQPVYNYELLFQRQDFDGTFGYQSRYAEYKFKPNEIHGQFANVLSYWHFGRIFDPLNPPNLSPEFVYQQEDDFRRAFAVQSVDGESLQPAMIWLHFEVTYLAKMSKFGTPMLLN